MKQWLGVVVVLAVTACASSLDKARSAWVDRDYPKAEQLYRKAMGEPKLAKTARDELARMYVKRAEETKDLAKAEPLYRRALEVEPTHDAALTGLVRLMRRTDRRPEAKALLEQTMAAGACEACARLLVVVLLELGERELEQEHWDEAQAYFAAAQEFRKQPAAAVAIANALTRIGELQKAVEALEDARGLMAGADESVRDNFFDVRAYLVAAAIDKKDLALADRTRAIALADEPPGKQLSLGLMIADHVYEGGDVYGAADRYVALLQLPNLDEPSKAKLVDKAAKIHANEATYHLHAGNGDAADKALSKAIELKPDDWVLKLQRVLALSARSGAATALESLGSVPKGTVGLADTRAILLSLRVEELLRNGDVAGAKSTLKEAQAAEPDLPEVHLAAARVLARTRVEDFEKRELELLRSGKSMVRYEVDVVRYGEALSEIDYVKAELSKRRKTGLFTAPWIGSATTTLEKEIFARYPHAVKFREQSEPLVVLFNGTGRTLDIAVQGPDDYRDRFVLAPDDLHELTPARAGVLKLKIGRKTKKVFFAEPFIEVTLKL